MSRGQLARTPANFPRMKVRGVARRCRPLDFGLLPWQVQVLSDWMNSAAGSYIIWSGRKQP